MARPDVFESLNALTGMQGEQAQSDFESAPLPYETPAMTTGRVQQAQTQRVQYGRMKAQDLAERGIPFDTSVRGNVSEITDATGAPLTNADKAHSIAYDSSGRPVDYSQKNPQTGRRVVKDAYEGVPDWTEPTTGNVYKKRAGLPWLYTGTDPAVQQQVQAKINAQTATALAPVEQQAKAQLGQASKQVKTSAAQLKQAAMLQGYQLDVSQTPEQIRKQIEDNIAAGMKSPEANDSHFWSRGTLTPAAESYRKELDAKKASLLSALDAHQQVFDSARQAQAALDQVKTKRQTLAGDKIQELNRRRVAAGLAPIDTGTQTGPTAAAVQAQGAALDTAPVAQTAAPGQTESQVSAGQITPQQPIAAAQPIAQTQPSPAAPVGDFWETNPSQPSESQLPTGDGSGRNTPISLLTKPEGAGATEADNPLESLAPLTQGRVAAARANDYKQPSWLDSTMDPSVQILKPMGAQEAGQVARAIDPTGILDAASVQGVNRVAGIIQNVTADTVNFFTSPAGIATLGIGALPRAVQKTIGAVFALNAVHEIPGYVREIAVAKTPEERDAAIKATIEQAAVLGGTTAHILDRVRAATPPGPPITRTFNDVPEPPAGPAGLAGRPAELPPSLNEPSPSPQPPPVAPNVETPQPPVSGPVENAPHEPAIASNAPASPLSKTIAANDAAALKATANIKVGDESLHDWGRRQISENPSRTAFAVELQKVIPGFDLSVGKQLAGALQREVGKAELPTNEPASGNQLSTLQSELEQMSPRDPHRPLVQLQIQQLSQGTPGTEAPAPASQPIVLPPPESAPEIPPASQEAPPVPAETQPPAATEGAAGPIGEVQPLAPAPEPQGSQGPTAATTGETTGKSPSVKATPEPAPAQSKSIAGPEATHAFLDEHGKVLSREQAGAVADAAGQRAPTLKGKPLHSEQLSVTAPQESGSRKPTSGPAGGGTSEKAISTKPTDVLHEAKNVKLTTPKGARFIRVTDSKGRQIVEPIENVTKGANVFHQAGPFKKVEIGVMDSKKNFVPLKGELTATDANAPKPAVEPTKPGEPSTPDEIKAAANQIKSAVDSIGRKASPEVEEAAKTGRVPSQEAQHVTKLANAALALHKANGTLDALGHPHAFEVGETRSGSGIETDVKSQRIRIDPEKLAQATAKLTPAARAEFVKRAVAEEVIHVGTLKYAAESETNRSKLLGLTKDEPLMEKAGKAYGPEWEKLPEFNKAAEAARMLLQGPEKLTEESYRFLKDFLEWMKTKLKNLSKDAREVLDGIRAKLGQYEKSSQETKEQAPPKSEAKPEPSETPATPAEIRAEIAKLKASGEEVPKWLEKLGRKEQITKKENENKAPSKTDERLAAKGDSGSIGASAPGDDTAGKKGSGDVLSRTRAWDGKIVRAVVEDQFASTKALKKTGYAPVSVERKLSGVGMETAIDYPEIRFNQEQLEHAAKVLEERGKDPAAWMHSMTRHESIHASDFALNGPRNAINAYIRLTRVMTPEMIDAYSDYGGSTPSPLMAAEHIARLVQYRMTGGFVDETTGAHDPARIDVLRGVLDMEQPPSIEAHASRLMSFIGEDALSAATPDDSTTPEGPGAEASQQPSGSPQDHLATEGASPTEELTPAQRNEKLMSEAESAGLQPSLELIKGILRNDTQAMNKLRAMIKDRTGKDALNAAKPEGDTPDAIKSAASRFKPKEKIEFKTPYSGPSGAQLTGYEWKWQPEEYVDKRGEDRIRHVSNWDDAESSAETGRDIVHQFEVKMPDGDVRLVSAETVPKLLGFEKGIPQKNLPSLVSATKTLAKQQMKLAIADAQHAENERIYEEVDKMTPPQVEGPELAFPGTTSKTIRFTIPGVGNGRGYQVQHESGPATQYTKDSLASQWRAARAAEMGYQRVSVDRRALKRMIEKQEQKIKLLTESTQEPLAAATPEQFKYPADSFQGRKEREIASARELAKARASVTSSRQLEESKARVEAARKRLEEGESIGAASPEDPAKMPLGAANPSTPPGERKIPGLGIFKNVKEGAQSLMLPSAVDAEHLEAAEVLGSKLGAMNHRAESARAVSAPAWMKFEKAGVHKEQPLATNAGVQFMSNASTGRPQAPEYRQYAELREKEYAKRMDALEKADVPLQNVRENYFPGVWTNESRRAFNLAMGAARESGIIPDGVTVNTATQAQKDWVRQHVEAYLAENRGSDDNSALGYLTKNPFKGKEGFRKQKVFDQDIITAMEFGLKPVSANPVDIDRLKWSEMDRNIMANEAMKEWKIYGQMRVIPPGARVPDGWEKVDAHDKHGLLNVYAPPDPNVYGRTIVGQRIVPHAVADILNNYLSSSLYNNRYFGTLYKGWMGFANALNQSQLGVGSAFHAGFTTAEKEISAGAEVIKDIYGVLTGNRHFGHLMGSVGGVVKAGWDTAKLISYFGRKGATGNDVLNAWRFPDQTIDPKIAKIVEAAQLAGGGFTMERGLQTDQTSRMVSDWYNGKALKAAARSPVAAIEMMAHPIMNYLVPRQKAGVFAMMAQRIIDQNPGIPMEELRPEFRQAWNRIDARMGQVRYDRLFANNVAKNVVQGVVRAPGWSGGTIAELGGAFKDTYSFFKEWAQTGKAPKNLPDRVAYTIALIAGTMIVNGVLTKLMTGENPEGLDYFAFRDGGRDEKGNPSRLILPTYMKDLLAYIKEPLGTLADKQHPVLSLIHDLVQNKDYYGVKITNEDDSALQKAYGRTKYVAKAFVPFWVRGEQKMDEQGKSLTEKVLPMIGIMPAAQKVTNTPAQKLASEYARESMPIGGRTQAQADKSEAERKIVQQIRAHKAPDVAKAIQSGAIKASDVPGLFQRAIETPLQSSFKHLSLDKAEAVYKVASPSEKTQLLQMLMKKREPKKTVEFTEKKRPAFDFK